MPSPSANVRRSTPVLLATMFVVAMTLVFGFVAMFRQGSSTAPAVLTVYCAAGLRAPVDAVAKAYEKETGVRVDLSFGGSQTLLANIEVGKTGDIYIPADDSYIALSKEKKLSAETIPLATMTPMLAVRKGNPKGLRSLSDLIRDGVKLSQANPDAAAIGKVVRAALKSADLPLRNTPSAVPTWDAIAAHTTVFKSTVNDAANDVALGAADAAFVWDAMALQYPALEFIALPELSNATGHVAAAILTSCRRPSEALKFARYLGARDKGLQEFAKNGYHVANGDPWAAQPEINMFAGAMLRPAIEQTITDFEQREGARVNRIYNGCGILVAEMRAGKHPDAYFACDTSFMNEVRDLFLDATNLSINQLVILVPKGNPHNINTLRDLAKPGLRIGVGHEKQCALGVLTRNTLLTNGSYMDVMKNVAVQSPTGDFLVNQLRARSLDAVIAYVSNAAGSANELEAIAVDIPCAIAAQPLAPSRETKYPQLTSRLVATLKSADSRERFRANGFRWTGQ